MIQGSKFLNCITMATVVMTRIHKYYPVRPKMISNQRTYQTILLMQIEDKRKILSLCVLAALRQMLPSYHTISEHSGYFVCGACWFKLVIKRKRYNYYLIKNVVCVFVYIDICYGSIWLKACGGSEGNIPASYTRAPGDWLS
jgi:hypothetical protein